MLWSGWSQQDNLFLHIFSCVYDSFFKSDILPRPQEVKILVWTTASKNAFRSMWTCVREVYFISWTTFKSPSLDNSVHPCSNQEGKQSELRKWFWTLFVSSHGPDWKLGNPHMQLSWYTTAGESGPLYWHLLCVYIQLLRPEHVQCIISSIFTIWQETVVPWKVTDVAIKLAWILAQLHASQLREPGFSLELSKGGVGLSTSGCTFKIRT